MHIIILHSFILNSEVELLNLIVKSRDKFRVGRR